MLHLSAIIDRPAGALATTGGALGVSWVARASASASEVGSIIAPFAALAGYATAFLVLAWWVRKWWRGDADEEAE